jgi:hypothetical protein
VALRPRVRFRNRRVLYTVRCQLRAATADFASSCAPQSAPALLPLRPDFRFLPLVRYAPGAAPLGAQHMAQLARRASATYACHLFAAQFAMGKSLRKKRELTDSPVVRLVRGLSGGFGLTCTVDNSRATLECGSRSSARLGYSAFAATPAPVSPQSSRTLKNPLQGKPPC